MSSITSRRLFGSLALLTAIASLAFRTRIVAAEPGASLTATQAAALRTNDAWLDALKGSHRQLFDAPNPNDGIPLVHIMNFYDTYNKAYATPDKDVNAILTFYGNTTFYGLNDAMWAKYKLGEFLKTIDPKTGKPAVSNPWRIAPVALGMTLPQASIESLQKRGATFIVCNNALGIFAGMVAQSRGLSADAVLADFKANILPGVTLVPGMVIAIEHAQERGITYHRQ